MTWNGSINNLFHDPDTKEEFMKLDATGLRARLFCSSSQATCDGGEKEPEIVHTCDLLDEAGNPWNMTFHSRRALNCHQVSPGTPDTEKQLWLTVLLLLSSAQFACSPLLDRFAHNIISWRPLLSSITPCERDITTTLTRLRTCSAQFALSFTATTRTNP
jgi:hypothetical protein